MESNHLGYDSTAQARQGAVVATRYPLFIQLDEYSFWAPLDVLEYDWAARGCLPYDCYYFLDINANKRDLAQRVEARTTCQCTVHVAHSMVLLRQHTGQCCHLLYNIIANVSKGARSALTKNWSRPDNLFRILNGTTVRAELAATEQAKHA